MGAWGLVWVSHSHRNGWRRFWGDGASSIVAAKQEIEARVTARAFGAVHNPEQGPAVRQVLAELLGVLDATSPDGVI